MMNRTLFNIDFFRNIRLVFQPRLWIPDLQISSILDLRKNLPRRIEGLVFDVDQTILPYGENDVSETIIDEIRILKANYACCLLSNYPKSLTRMKRLKEIENRVSIPLIISNRKKPDPEPFHAAITHLKGKGQNIAIIGDRILTDILGGNNVGLTTVLVKPLKPKSDPFVWVTIPRLIEQLFFQLIIHLKGRNIHET